MCLFLLIIFRHALLTDYYLQVKNSNGRIYAMGDCCTIEQRKLLSNVREIFTDADKNGDGKLNLEEFKGKPWLERQIKKCGVVKMTPLLSSKVVVHGSNLGRISTEGLE